jgi:hypothetical protein
MFFKLIPRIIAWWDYLKNSTLTLACIDVEWRKQVMWSLFSPSKDIACSFLLIDRISSWETVYVIVAGDVTGYSNVCHVLAVFAAPVDVYLYITCVLW